MGQLYEYRGMYDERAEDFYHDESGERFRQVYRLATERRRTWVGGFWLAIVAFCLLCWFVGGWLITRVAQ